MDAVPELIAIGGVVTTGGAVTGDRHDFARLVAVGVQVSNRSLRKVLIYLRFNTPLEQQDFKGLCKRISIGAKYRHWLKLMGRALSAF